MDSKQKSYECPNCGAEKPDFRGVCPQCGYEDKTVDSEDISKK